MGSSSINAGTWAPISHLYPPISHLYPPISHLYLPISHLYPPISHLYPRLVICTPQLVICNPQLVICTPRLVICTPQLVICTPFLRSIRRARGSTTGRRIPILREQLGPLRQILIRWVSKIRKLFSHVPRILSKSTEPRLSGYSRRKNRRRVGIQTEIFHRFMTEKI